MENHLTRRIDTLYTIGNTYKNERDAIKKRTELSEFLPHLTRLHDKILKLNSTLLSYGQITNRSIDTAQVKATLVELKTEVNSGIYDKTKILLLENLLNQIEKEINVEWIEMVSASRGTSDGMIETIKGVLTNEQRVEITKMQVLIDQSSPFSVRGKELIDQYSDYCATLFGNLKLGSIGEEFFSKLNRNGSVQLKSLTPETLDWLLKSEFAAKLFISYKS